MRKQVEYYFSSSNLERDNYLRCLMDKDGWVPIALLQTFPKVQQMNLKLQEIIQSLALSSELVVSSVVVTAADADSDTLAAQALVRKGDDWERWPMEGALFFEAPEVDGSEA